MTGPHDPPGAATAGTDAHTATGRDGGRDAAVAAVLNADPGSFVWDSQEAVAYEVALEAIHRALGALGHALRRPEIAADPVETARLQGERRAAVAALNLDPTDHPRVDAITVHFNQLAAGLPLPVFPGI